MRRPRHTSLRLRSAVVTALGIACFASASGAATSGTVVGATVPSATNISTSGCASLTAGITQFGAVLPGSSAVTTADCVVQFGSSNDTSSLRVSQPDGLGSAMWQLPTVPDTTFSGDGSATSSPGTGVHHGRAGAVASNGDVIAAGYDTSSPKRIVVQRWTVDGTAAGSAAITVSPTAPVATVNDVEITASGQVYVVYTVDRGATGDIGVIRLTSGLALDGTFGSGGIASFGWGAGSNDEAGRSILLPDGDLLVSGGVWTQSRAATLRVNSDGSPDTGWGTNGFQLVNLSATSEICRNVIALRAGGYACAANVETATAGIFRAAAVKLTSTGTLDTSFASGSGLVTFSTGLADTEIGGLLEHSSGAIYVGGYDAGTADPFAYVAASTAAGAPLPGFGSGGVRILNNASTWDDGADVYELPDGSLEAIGYTDAGAPGGNTLLARLDAATGAGVSGFGANGVAAVDIVPGQLDDPYATAQAPDGRIAIVGEGAGTGLWVGMLGGLRMNDLASGVHDWSAGGSSTGRDGVFGICLRAATTATASWPSTGTCAAANGTNWRGVPVAASTAATTASGTTNATANFRFGLRAVNSQLPGTYVAPVQFDVVAPLVP